MVDRLSIASAMASSGLEAQSKRLRVIAENIANSHSTAKVAGGDPYVRKVVAFSEVLAGETKGVSTKVTAVPPEKSPFPIVHDPANPAADEFGRVKLPNVNPLVEMADMREAGNSYDANLQVIRQSREMVGELIDLLRGR